MRRALALAALSTALLAGSGQAQDRYDRDRDDRPPAGNYLRTCRNITVFNYGPNATISGQCRDETGRWRDTSARFSGCERLDNRDGQLICRGGQGGGYGPPPSSAGGGGGGYRPPPPAAAYGSQIALYSAPNFGGERFQTFDEVTNLPKRYNDVALSLKIEGRGAWEVCVDSDFKGRCEVFDSDVPDLRFYGLGYAISSLRPAR
jgi:Beta/Gamma crystallin